MRAVIAQAAGAKPVVADDIAQPQPGAGELLVLVTAAGVNPIDWKSIERGDREFPAVLGQDFAGVVVSIGDGVTAFEPDQRVFGIARRHGAFAEYTVVPHDDAAQPVAPIPGGLADVDAAALPTAGLTALAAIDVLRLAAGSTMLILGVSGGVGSFAAQIALARGIRVIGTAHSKSEAYVRSLGDVEFVAYDREEPVSAALVRSPGGVDGALDLVDDEAEIKVISEAVKRGGTIVSTIGALDEAWFEQRKLTGVNLIMNETPRSSPEGLLELARMVESGEITIRLAAEPHFDEAVAALEESKAGAINGKIVIAVKPASIANVESHARLENA
jgi:NADPH:quinone reductase-like Zn-dependent oxidoreductase